MVDVVLEEPVAAVQPVGTVTWVPGVAAPSSSTAAIDMTLLVEPGSYTSWRAALPSEAEVAWERSLGS